MGRKTISTDFVTKLLSQLSVQDNSVICPHGIAAVLSMAAEGAWGAGLNEILECLGFDTLEQLRNTVLDAIKNPCAAFTSENTVELQKGMEDLALRELFQQTLTGQYAATVREEQGNGHGHLRLMNVANFQAKWLVKIKTAEPGNDHFRNQDGTVTHPVFLVCTDQLRHYRDDAFTPTVQAVALPYKLNGLAIPYELVLVDSSRSYTPELLEEILSNMQRDECSVEFPAFFIESQFNLIPMLQALGIQSMFDREKSTLDYIATEPVYASSFCQKAQIRVDENGTVAQAITYMTMELSCGIFKLEEFRFDRPFCYFLRNTDTGEILFAGRVNQLPDHPSQN